MGLLDKFKKKKQPKEEPAKQKSAQLPTPDNNNSQNPQSGGDLPPMPDLPDLPDNMETPPAPDASQAQQTGLQSQEKKEENKQQQASPDSAAQSDPSQELPDIPMPNTEDSSAKEQQDLPDIPDTNTSEPAQTQQATDAKKKSDEDSFLNENTGGDFDDMELPDFSDETFDMDHHEEKPQPAKEPVQATEETDDFAEEEKQDVHKELIHINEVEEGPRYMKVNQYVKITDVTSYAKQEIETIIEEGNKLLNLDGSKTKNIDTFKSDINDTVKLLYNIENTLFKGD